jgi:hypothetical protein
MNVPALLLARFAASNHPTEYRVLLKIFFFACAAPVLSAL